MDAPVFGDALTSPTSVSQFWSEFDAFLCAPVEERTDGPLLSVISVLAQLDIDPWQEAANLAQMSRLLLSVVVHPANIQDRDGAALVLNKRTRRLFPLIERIYADGEYKGPRARAAAARAGTWKIEIIKRSDIAKGFVFLPKRWVVERTLAWISRNRRLSRDFERYATTVTAFICLAMIRIMLRRLTRPCPSN
jgi:transposase